MESISIEVIKNHVMQYLNDTYDGRVLAERDRDYKDHKQWTQDEVNALLKRKQAPIVVNRIRPKVEGLVGLYVLRHTDPKAYPRTQKHEDSAHAITDALRYVADNTDFEQTKIECADEFFVEGVCGAIVDVQMARDDVEVRVRRIPWDRLYYDPHSRDKFFEDARFKGMMVWLDKEQIEEMFPDFDTGQLVNHTLGDGDTFEDRPDWTDWSRDRFRVALHFFMHKGTWYYCVFNGDTFIVEPDISPYLDENGVPVCPIELCHANIDRDNQRYGEVRGWISLQDEVNHRRSKALHLLSQRQTASRKGAIKDISGMKRELAKPDGHVEYTGEQGDFQVLNTGDMARGQFDLHMEAKAELDAVSFNAQLSGERQQGDLSGRAIDKLQAAGTIELNRQYKTLSGWERRIYRQIWARVKQFWTQEKWIRITDDQDSLKWVGLNYQTTAQEWMEEQINDESLSLKQRKALAASYTFLTQAAQGPDPQLVQMAQMGDIRAAQAVRMALLAQQEAQARLSEIVEVKNPVADLDVDIIVDQSFDVINADQEKLNMLIQFAMNSPDIDIITLIDLMNLRGKDELIERIEERRQQATQASANLQQIQAAEVQAKVEETNAKTAKLQQEAIARSLQNTLLQQQEGVKASKAASDIARNRAETTQKNIENLLLITQPERVNSISV